MVKRRIQAAAQYSSCIAFELAGCRSSRQERTAGWSVSDARNGRALFSNPSPAATRPVPHARAADGTCSGRGIRQGGSA